MHQTTSHYLDQWLLSLLTHICVTRFNVLNEMPFLGIKFCILMQISTDVCTVYIKPALVQMMGFTPIDRPTIILFSVDPVHWRLHTSPGERFKNTYELLNLRALKISTLYKNRIFQCMSKIFSVEFQRYLLKFHTKYLTHTLKDEHFIHENLSVLRFYKCFWNTPDLTNVTYRVLQRNSHSMNIRFSNPPTEERLIQFNQWKSVWIIHQ